MPGLATSSARWLKFRVNTDSRGSLVALESGKSLPICIKRVFYLFDNENAAIRGRHAHKYSRQVMISLHGSCIVGLDDGRTRRSVNLENGRVGLYVDRMVWTELLLSPGSIVLVLTDTFYDEADYIRDYKEFLRKAPNSVSSMVLRDSNCEDAGSKAKRRVYSKRAYADK